MEAGVPRVTGYAYAGFCRGVAALHGEACWLRPVLEVRGAAVPSGLLECDGELDGHHLLSKARIKRNARELTATAVALALNDPRNGVPVCRRHHDLLTNHAVVLFRDELPPPAVHFAEEIGMLGWLERDYPERLPVESVEDRRLRDALRVVFDADPSLLSDYGQGRAA